MMKQETQAINENRRMAATLFVFFVSGASSVLMGMGVVVAVTVLLLITILVSVCSKGSEDQD